MVILRFITFITFFICLNTYGFVINEVKVNCGNLENCEPVEESLEQYVGKELSVSDIKEALSFLSYDSTIKRLSYEILQEQNRNTLIVFFEKKLKIDEIVIQIDSDLKIDVEEIVGVDEVKQQLSLKKGSLFNEKEVRVSEKILEKYLHDKGISRFSFEFVKEVENNLVSFKVKIKINSLQTIRNIKLEGERILSRDLIYFTSFISQFKNKNWDRLKVKLSLDGLAQEIFKSGYYFSKISPEYIEIDKNTVDIIINIDFGEQVSFGFRGSTYFSKQELMNYLRDQIKTDSNKLSEIGLESALTDLYKQVGVYNTKVQIRVEKGITKFKDPFQFYYIKILEGTKLKIDEFDIQGIKNLSLEEAMQIYYRDADSLILNGFLREDHLEKFVKNLKEYYLNKGFLFIEVSEPKIKIDMKKNTVDILIGVKELRQTKVSEIEIIGVPKSLKEELLKDLNNKVGEDFRVLNLEKDLEVLISRIKNLGYYFAQYKTLREKDILNYAKDYSTVSIAIEIDLGDLVKLNKIIVTGNESTRHFVITREVHMRKGDLITPQAIRNINANINSLSLFSTVNIKLLNSKLPQVNLYDLIIHVNEKDFGVGEISLGYRTDTGLRSAVGINYNNLDGRNWTLSSKLEANYRLSLETLDDERQDEEKRFIEWDANIGILFPYLGDFPIRSEVSTSHKRQRYKTFDANIFTLQVLEAVDLSRVTSFSLKYQFDSVDQFDATNDEFNDKFQIGSITPSLNFDFRDNPVNPKKGAYFGLSWEFANPTLFSNNDQDLIVNFDKLTSRNKFYYPIGQFYGLALSISAGKETNRATEPLLDENGNIQYDNGTIITQGYIPSIRVFRLDGQDTVRGFSDTEINLLGTGEDISSIAIRDSAYFVNMKFEIRNFINDLMIAGLFVDAGRIYINTFKPLDLRTSFGTTFKFVTPVGSLDFDYGIKFRRVEYSDSGREAFGRFHLSIGFF